MNFHLFFLILCFILSYSRPVKVPYSSVSQYDLVSAKKASNSVIESQRTPVYVSTHYENSEPLHPNAALRATSDIYGITLSDCAKSPELINIDPITGDSTSIVEDLSVPYGSEINYGCVDPVHNIYYHVYLNGLFGFNLTTSENIDPIDLSGYLAVCEVNSCGSRIACDPNTGDVYVWGFDVNDDTYYSRSLLRVGRATNGGVFIDLIKEYADFGPCELLFAPPSTYDSKRNTIWFSVIKTSDENCDNLTDAYFAINAKTGEITNTVDISSWPLYTIDYYAEEDALVSVVPDAGSFQLEFFDPVTLETQKSFDPIGVTSEYSFQISALDPMRGITYFVPYNESGVFCGYSLIGVNLTSGELVSNGVLCSNPSWNCVDSLAYWK